MIILDLAGRLKRNFKNAGARITAPALVLEIIFSLQVA
jgi:hypothetical protein